MDESKAKIETQFKLLDLAERETEKIIARNRTGEIERHLNYVERKLETIQDMKDEVQEFMVFNEEQMENLEEWSNQLEESVLRYHVLVDKLKNEVRATMKMEEDLEKQKEEEKHEQKFQRRMEEELEIEKKKKLGIQKKSYKKRREIVREGRYRNVKLPKLIITKFEGTHIDWFCYWNQYEPEIDRSELHPVSKFNYLKELLAPKVRLLIDALTFTSEGYSRAIAILKAKFGKLSEVSAAHIQCVLSLPVITNSNRNRVHEFYEKLVISVQALETMNKLKEINGYVRLTLDKLPGIRADLVRLDHNWQEWHFAKLLDSLRR